MPRSSLDTHHCPNCHQGVQRVHRTEGDPREGSASGLRRYGCVDAACNWQGLLPRVPRSTRASHRSARPARSVVRSTPSRRRLWLLTGGLLGVLMLGVAGLVTMALRPDRPADAGALSRSAAPHPSAPALQPRR